MSSDPQHLSRQRPLGNRSLWSLVAPLALRNKKRFYGLVIAIVVAASTLLSVGIGIRQLINQGLSSQSGLQLEHTLMLLVALVCLLATSSFWRLILVTRIGEEAAAHLRIKAFKRILHQPVSFFESRKTGEILSALTTDIATIQLLMGGALPVAVRNFLIFGGGTIMLFLTSPLLASLVFLVVPLIVIPLSFYGKKVKRASKTLQDTLGKVNATAEETLYAIKTVMAFSGETRALQQFQSENEGVIQAAGRQIQQRAWLTVMVMVIAFLAISGVLLWGGLQVQQGSLSGGELSAFIFYAILVAGSLNSLGETLGETQRSAGAAERLLNILDLPLPASIGSSTQTFTPQSAASVSFSHISFAYPARPQHPVLDNISFHIQPGEMVAFVGPSGAGKSTLFQLLLRFYDPHSGAISLNGQESQSVPLETWRDHMALVPQETIIFSTTVYENIAYGNPNATRQDILEAAKIAAVDLFVEALPQKYDTLVGEKGVRLSGGQKQRIVLARALVKKAPILLLDEATSALDSQNEQMIQTTLMTLRKSHTILVIAHRLSTIKQADRIIVLDHGKIAEEGSHAALMAQSGIYHSLAKLQFEA